MAKFRGKQFNDEVWELYQKTLPSTKKNSLISSAIFSETNEYEAKMKGQVGGYFIVEPIKGRIGGDPVNYDGNTDIPAGSERPTYLQTKICYGRANAWGEYDFVSSLTGENFKAEAGEVKEYWDEERQKTTLAMLKGFFNMTGGVDGQFVEKHTYRVNDVLNADSCNKASQKALGDMKQDLSVMFMHSAVSTNLEGLNLINFLKYTDKDGIEKELQIGQYNGKTVIVDDDMPTEDIYEKSVDTEVDASKTYYTKSGDVYTKVEAPTGNPSTKNYYEFVATEYTTYMFANKFFEHENLSVEKPVEIDRDAKTKGGKTDLISRVREIIVPKYISYKNKTLYSPMNSDFANGANWEIANNGDSSNKLYVNDKLIPLVRIISRG